ncbi:hypothetical protein ACFXOM_35180 [Streptomyces sp. NPDC059169]|uniref:hypothetical protein n=1 Tax=unclassified Streptomyces TaxID=2593676 RepID=UPI00367647F3
MPSLSFTTSQSSNCLDQSAYSSEPTTATSPVRSSSASAVKTIASKCLRTNCPVRVLSTTALRQFCVAKEMSTSFKINSLPL